MVVTAFVKSNDGKNKILFEICNPVIDHLIQYFPHYTYSNNKIAQSIGIKMDV